MAATDEPPPFASFDEQALDSLLTELRTLHEALARGIDASASAIVERPPGLWYRLEALERRIQRQLPLLREELRRLERALRDAVPGEQRAPPPLIRSSKPRPGSPQGSLVAMPSYTQPSDFGRPSR
jgi:hypothetical protein